MAGQIIKRGDATWLVRIYLGRDAKGKRKYHNKTVHGPKKAAERYRNRVLRERDTGTFVEPSRKAVEEYCREWIRNAKPGIRPRTRESYAWVLEQYVIPHLGSHRLDQLQPAHVQSLYRSLAEERGLSPRTIRYTHAILRAALGQAVKWGLLAKNAADLVELPAEKPKKIRALPAGGARAFLEASEGTRWHALWVTLIGSGMRPGEALGLKWEDMDLDAGTARIQRVLVRQAAGVWSFQDPKTAKSKRAIALPLLVTAALRKHRQKQAAERLAAGDAWEDLDLVFSNSQGRPLDYRTTVRRYFKPLLRAAGLPEVRPYDLRHTCATLLLEAGVHPKVVSERLGHTSIAMTLDTYSHVFPHMQRAAAEQLEKVLSLSPDSVAS